MSVVIVEGRGSRVKGQGVRTACEGQGSRGRGQGDGTLAGGRNDSPLCQVGRIHQCASCEHRIMAIFGGDARPCGRVDEATLDAMGLVVECPRRKVVL